MLARPWVDVLGRVTFLQRPCIERDAGRIGLELRKISRAKSTASERKLRAVVCAVLSAPGEPPLRTVDSTVLAFLNAYDGN